MAHFFNNYLHVDRYHRVKYADDTTFYKPIRDPNVIGGSEAIMAAQIDCF